MYRDLVLFDPEVGEGWAENKQKNHKWRLIVMYRDLVLFDSELGEGWAENKQPVAGDDGVVFYLKYLGFTLVDEVDDDESYGDGASTKAVQRIVAMVSVHIITVLSVLHLAPSPPPPFRRNPFRTPVFCTTITSTRTLVVVIRLL